MRPSLLYSRLESRFDGEIPDHLRRAAVAGGEAAIERAIARATSRACDRMALAALRRAAERAGEANEIAAWRRLGLRSLRSAGLDDPA
jgi:hypothetical protein